jgi:hypothetical protein
MAFRNTEAARIFNLRDQLFSTNACQSLLQDEHRFRAGFEQENIYDGFRQEALAFFKRRKIKWHGGRSCDISIVSSQIACLNCFFQFASDPVALKCWLSQLYPDLQEVLPISSAIEPSLPDRTRPFVTFEWIGERNYLNERGQVRGQNRTSVDVMFRFRTNDQRIHIVLAEWKYCEAYKTSKYRPISDSGTDRFALYRPQLDATGCQLSLGSVPFEKLFFDPIYQLMRLQLLASAMERGREMDADVVSVLHISPRASGAVLNLELSRQIAPSASTVGEVWRSVAVPYRFKSIATEDLISMLIQSGANSAWTKYISKRYGTRT